MIEDRVNGLLVPPRDAEALAEAIVALLRSPAERARRGAAGPATVASRFSVDRMVEGNVAVYRRLLAARPRSTAPAGG
jgi:glycosyltransferase involved in cell wall biosynthesis